MEGGDRMKDIVPDKAVKRQQSSTTSLSQDISHPVLDVYSVKQGALHLQIWLVSVAFLVFLGLYFCVGAVINYNQVDSDARDIITNMRQMLPPREFSHSVSNQVCVPRYLRMGLAGSAVEPSRVDPTAVYKSRSRLTDPRLLAYSDVVQPMVVMRQMNDANLDQIPTTWTYYTATFPSVEFPSFAIGAILELTVTFLLDSNSILHAAQMFNEWEQSRMPTISYQQSTNSQDLQVWTIELAYKVPVRAFRLKRVENSANLIVERVSKVFVETNFVQVDVPAMVVETDVASDDYNNGQPVFKTVMYSTNATGGEGTLVSCEKLFNVLVECRDTVSVPSVLGTTVLEYVLVYEGPVSGIQEALATEPAEEVQIVIRDMSQPRPYAPLMTGFGQPFFTGFAFLAVAIIFLLTWSGLRYHLVIKNVRENEGKPPMFYQGMLRFRGW